MRNKNENEIKKKPGSLGAETDKEKMADERAYSSERMEAPEPAAAAAEVVDQPSESQDNPEKIIADLQNEKSELFDKLLRKQAEFENYRKRVDRERADWYQAGIIDVVREILPVIDGCERALASFKDLKPVDVGAENYRSGFELLYKQLQTVLKRFGISTIDAVGSEFDPYLHEAVVRVESDEHEENKVIEELQKGYIYKDKLIRPTQVKVTIKPVPTQSS